MYVSRVASGNSPTLWPSSTSIVVLLALPPVGLNTTVYFGYSTYTVADTVFPDNVPVILIFTVPKALAVIFPSLSTSANSVFSEAKVYGSSISWGFVIFILSVSPGLIAILKLEIFFVKYW